MLATQTAVHTAVVPSNGKCHFQPPPADPPAPNENNTKKNNAEKNNADKPAFSNARARIAEIQQLWLQGYSTYEIADQLGEPPRDVGRNLREIRKRLKRAAQRQSQALVVAQCAEIGREAMDAWRHSQGTQRVVTTRHKDGAPDTVTTRTEDKPGNPAFLNAALRATQAVARLAAELPAAPKKSADAARLALMEVLTPEQSAVLTPKQREDFVAAFQHWKELLSAGAAASEPPSDQAPAAESREPSDSGAASADPAAGDQQLPSAEERGAAERPRLADLPQPGPLSEEEATGEGASETEPEHECNRGPAVRDPQAGAATVIRNPEWPAESFLTRGWPSPDRRMAPDAWKNAASAADRHSVCAASGTK